MAVEYEWDEAKRIENIKKHGLDFSDAGEFDWESALEIFGDVDENGEERWLAVGFIDLSLSVLVYVERGLTVRMISLRKATKNEERLYAENTPY